MELQKLRYFYVAAKFQHFTKAAEYLYIAQPYLTQAIKSLEEELNVPLFEKKGRNIILTEYGEFLKRRLDTILPEIDGIKEELERMKCRVDKTVRLNILAASLFVIDAIVSYRKKHPDVIFDFEQIHPKNDCDIVIATNGVYNKEKKQYVKRCVKKEKIYLAVPKESAYSDLKTVDLADMKNEGFVMLSDARLFGSICNKFCQGAGFFPKVLFESDSPMAVQNIISTGTGVAFWPEYSWGELNNENVSLIPIANPICQRELIFELYDRFPKSLYAEDFYEHLLKCVNKNGNEKTKL